YGRAALVHVRLSAPGTAHRPQKDGGETEDGHDERTTPARGQEEAAVAGARQRPDLRHEGLSGRDTLLPRARGLRDEWNAGNGRGAARDRGGLGDRKDQSRRQEGRRQEDWPRDERPRRERPRREWR